MSGATWCANVNPNPPDMQRLLTRRGFLRAGLTASALLSVQAVLPARAWAEACDGVLGTVPAEQRSIQLFTMLPFIQATPDLTLQQLYSIGYRRVEHAVLAQDAEAFRASCDNAGPEGIWSSSGHQDIPHPYDEAAFQAVLDFSQTVGQRFIVRASFDAPDEAGWAAYGESLNQAGRAARAAGLESVGHHNHTQEYTPFEEGTSRRPIDVLMEVCDPEITHMEMDLCWVWSSETDPVEYLEKYPGRYRQFHVKDMGPTGQPTFPGLGVIDFNRIFEAAADTQVIEEYIIEQDGASAASFQTAQMGWDLLEDAEFACPAPDTSPGGDPSGTGDTPTPAGGASGDTATRTTTRSGPDLPTTGGGLAVLAASMVGAAIHLRRRGDA